MSSAARRLHTEPGPMPYVASGKLAGCVALIGGNPGIAHAVALLFAREGAYIALIHAGSDLQAHATAEAVKRDGRRALVLNGDVEDAPFCRQAVANVMAAFGHLDIIVSDADPGCIIDAAEPQLTPGASIIVSTAVAGTVQRLAATLAPRGIRVNGIAPAPPATIAPAYVFFASAQLSGPMTGQSLALGS